MLVNYGVGHADLCTGEDSGGAVDEKRGTETSGGKREGGRETEIAMEDGLEAKEEGMGGEGWSRGCWRVRGVAFITRARVSKL